MEERQSARWPSSRIGASTDANGQSCRPFGLREFVAGVMLLAATATLSAQVATDRAWPKDPPLRTAAELDETRTLVNAELGLRASRLANLPADRLHAHATLDLPIDADAPLRRTVHLRPVSPLGKRYQRVVYDPRGPIAEPPHAPATVRGTFPELNGAELAGSLTADGLSALVLLPDGDRIWIEPAPAVGGTSPGDHVVYRDEDRLEPGAACGLSDPVDSAQSILDAHAFEPAGIGDDPNDLRFTELALDTDFEYYAHFGSAAAVEADVTNLINIVNLQYEREVRISYVIVRLIVRPAEPDPYTTTNHSTLLDQFRNHWLTQQSTVHRDVAHFFTGKLLQSGVSGVAFYSGICSTIEGYGLVSRRACSSTACRTDLTAHELGHNWAAPHCNCSGYTMNPIVQGSNRFHPDFSIPIIVNYRESEDVNCLEIGDDLEAIVISSPVTTVAETNEIVFSAAAQYRLHIEQNVTADVAWTVDPPSLGTIDSAGRFVAANVDGPLSGSIGAAYTFDGTQQSDSVSITVIDAEPPPLRDSATPDKNRFLSIAVPPGSGEVAVAIRALSLYNPDPPHPPSVLVPDFGATEGEVRWVGPPMTCFDASGPAAHFRCAALRCSPYYAPDWGTDVIHVMGGEIMPASEYEVRTYPANPCRDAEGTCGMASAPLFMKTQRYGDVVAPFQDGGGPPGTATQPNVLDISAIVTRLKGLPGIPLHQAVLRANSLEAASELTVLDVSDSVDAVKGLAPLWIGGCGCPSPWTCPNVDFCGRCVPEE